MLNLTNEMNELVRYLIERADPITLEELYYGLYWEPAFETNFEKTKLLEATEIDDPSERAAFLKKHLGPSSLKGIMQVKKIDQPCSKGFRNFVTLGAQPSSQLN